MSGKSLRNWVTKFHCKHPSRNYGRFHVTDDVDNSVPHVASWFQGIHHTINIPLSTEMAARDIRNLFADRFAGEKLIKITGESPSVKSIMGKHGVEVGGFGVHSSGKRVIVNVTIDNLLKGAATQCLREFACIYEA